MVIVGWEGDGWLRVHDFVEIVQNGDDPCIVADPRPDLDRTLARIKVNFGDGPWITILGIAWLDLADASACQALVAANAPNVRLTKKFPAIITFSVGKSVDSGTFHLPCAGVACLP